MRAFVLLLGMAMAAHADSAGCRACHQKIYDDYQQTGMARSFSKVTSVPPLQKFDHEASKQQYSVVQRGGTSYLRRSEPPLERSIDYAIGSGDHSKTFVHRDSSGRLTELPVSWYAEAGGSWHMSPGYDRPDHSGFQREVSDSCMFCHNGYPPAANGIDCERCHGPGEAHANGKGSIVNPAKLSAARQFEVCLQCHLESASRTLPDSIRRFGRSTFSYRPGEPLADYTLYFEFANARSDNRITVNGAAYGLMKSQCYLRSAGRLQCTTCHDPHRQITAAEAEGRYTRACRSCHAAEHEVSTRDCAGCHMQKRRTEDAVHVVMTDHLIRRRPIAGDALAMIPERHDRLSGPVKLLYPATLPESPDKQIYLAMAQADLAALETAITKAKPAHPEPYFALGEALRKAGRTQDAIRAFRRVIDLNPGDPRAYIAAADLMMKANQIDEAAALIQPALDRIPNDPRLLNSAAVVYAGQRRFDEAIALLAKALAVNADYALSWLNLAVCLEAKGDAAGAANAYRQAVTLNAEFGVAQVRTTTMQPRPAVSPPKPEMQPRVR